MRWRFNRRVVLGEPVLERFVADMLPAFAWPVTAWSCKRRDVFLCGREELMRRPSPGFPGDAFHRIGKRSEVQSAQSAA